MIYIGKHAADALRAIRPAEELLDLQAPVFNLSPQQIGRRVSAVAKAAGLGEDFTGHSGRVCMAQDLAITGTELPGRPAPTLRGSFAKMGRHRLPEQRHRPLSTNY